MANGYEATIHSAFTCGIICQTNTNHRSWSIFIGLVIVIAMCLAAWFFAPKGENQV
jgi:hypothetical protein